MAEAVEGGIQTCHPFPLAGVGCLTSPPVLGPCAGGQLLTTTPRRLLKSFCLVATPHSRRRMRRQHGVGKSALSKVWYLRPVTVIFQESSFVGLSRWRLFATNQMTAVCMGDSGGRWCGWIWAHTGSEVAVVSVGNRRPRGPSVSTPRCSISSKCLRVVTTSGVGATHSSISTWEIHGARRSERRGGTHQHRRKFMRKIISGERRAEG